MAAGRFVAGAATDSPAGDEPQPASSAAAPRAQRIKVGFRFMFLQRSDSVFANNVQVAFLPSSWIAPVGPLRNPDMHFLADQAGRAEGDDRNKTFSRVRQQ